MRSFVNLFAVMNIHDIKSNGLLLLECISGSRAYGLETAQSDTDIKGVFYLPRTAYFGIDYIPQVSNETNDEVYYEIGRFVDLLLKNNPNLLELLATPADCILYRHPLMDKLPLKLFLSRKCRDSFAGYAFSQIRKAQGFNKKINQPLPAERKTLLQFCYILNDNGSIPVVDWLLQQGIKQEQCGLAAIAHTKGLYTLYVAGDNEAWCQGIISGNEANDVTVSSVPKGQPLRAYLSVNTDGYSMYCREYKEYWDWVKKRNEVRYTSNLSHGKNYDAKNMMHTIRLLEVGREIIQTGQLQVRRANRTELLAIKNGQWEYQELLDYAEKLMQDIELAYPYSPLPEEPDQATALQQLISIREQLYCL